MNSPLRFSAIHDAVRSLPGLWRDINGMPTLWTLPDSSPKTIGIADLSALTRWGVKGAQAADWLSQQGLPIPEQPNTWVPLPEGGLIARLGRTEFLIEDSVGSAIAPRLAAACQSPPPKVYPVLRQDLALGMVGDRLPDLLRQTCSFNFQALALADRPVILTSMIGVAVTILPGELHGQPFYRIWCDGTFGDYLWCTLLDIAIELGGGAVGTELVQG